MGGTKIDDRQFLGAPESAKRVQESVDASQQVWALPPLMDGARPTLRFAIEEIALEIDKNGWGSWYGPI